MVALQLEHLSKLASGDDSRCNFPRYFTNNITHLMVKDGEGILQTNHGHLGYTLLELTWTLKNSLPLPPGLYENAPDNRAVLGCGHSMSFSVLG